MTAGRKAKHRWTDEEREIVRRDYTGTRESAMEIAGRLGVSFLAVKGQVGILGLAKRSGRRPWTPEEDRQLSSLIQQKGSQLKEIITPNL